MQRCPVCENPRRPNLTTSQIEWHNMGHPGLGALRTPARSTRLRSIVVIRPGDQILYEIQPGSWRPIDELDIAVAAGHSVSELASYCRRCARPVLDRRLARPGILRSLIEKIALKTFRKPED
jgi:hypothetical protein